MRCRSELVRPRHCRLTVGDGFVGLRSEPGRSIAAEVPEMTRTVTVRSGSSRFVTSPQLPGSQEVDGSIPFSSTIRTSHLRDSFRGSPFSGSLGLSIISSPDVVPPTFGGQRSHSPGVIRGVRRVVLVVHRPPPRATSPLNGSAL